MPCYVQKFDAFPQKATRFPPIVLIVSVIITSFQKVSAAIFFLSPAK